MRLLLSLGISLAAIAGCSSAEERGSGEAAAEVTAAEVAQARAATTLVKSRCSSCHTASKADIRRWGEALTAVENQCLSPSLTLTAAERVACLRDGATFTEAKLGFYAAASTHTALRTLFEQGGPALYETFEQQASMPPINATTPRLTEAEFASLKTWVLAGMPALDEALVESGAPCVPSTTQKLAAHLAEMKVSGWAARHAEASVPMHGCAAGESGTACLTTYPDVTSAVGAAGVAQTVRKLYELPFSTYAWTRSSPDGRFTAFGGSPSKVVDHAGPRIITVNAEFDPAFFPDNAGFAYAEATGRGVTVCPRGVLLNAAAAANPSISLSEPGCRLMTSRDYQAIGAALDGTLFFMASGTHENDVTFSLTHGPLRAQFPSTSTTNVLPMVSDGNTYVQRTPITVAHPFEGDGGLSASTKLFYTRFGSAAGQRGYRIRRLTAHGVPLSLATEELATVCLSGGKPMGSFDERFIVTHQYVDPAENPGATVNSANVMVFDLLTGETIRLTNLRRGEYAFSPVFRADGWIYFVIKDANTRKETLYATDAIVRRL